ncbi:MAG: hypothetical protein ACJAQ4_001253 [Cryomorphaceae bacterium]|jgi:hypothetical protein
MKSFKKHFSTFVHTGLAVFVVLSLSSCNDDEDENPPRITIEFPFENQIFLSTDTIEASAVITDNEQIISVELEILDLAFNQVAARRSYPASGSTFNFGQRFPIDAPQLQTGDYYLAFRANDGRNVGSAFVKVRIIAIPRELEGVLVLTSQSNQSYIYYCEEGENEFELEHNFFSDAVGGGLNYRQDIFATAGGEAGDADFFETEEFSTVNSLPGFGNTGLPFYLSMTFDDNLEQFILTERDGRVRVLDKSAFVLLGFDGLANHLPLKVFGNEDGYFLSEKEIDGPLYSFTFYSFQGLLLDNYLVAGAVRGVFDRNVNEKFVWVDDPEGLELRLLNVSTEFLSLPYERPGASLSDVIRTGNNTFIISTSDGLLRYNYSNGGTVILNSSAPEGDLYFDDLNQLIYLTSGQDARIYAINGQQVAEFSFPREIIYVGFDYNR